MPRYDYSCPTDGEFEATVTFKNADKAQPCPTCGKKVKRMARLYAPGINYCDGMTKHPAVIDSENTRKYGHTV
jgi:putative FmdB family regulatory protein